VDETFSNLPPNINRERFTYCRMDINGVTDEVALRP
jgi:hypothetical protein